MRYNNAVDEAAKAACVAAGGELQFYGADRDPQSPGAFHVDIAKQSVHVSGRAVVECAPQWTLRSTFNFVPEDQRTAWPRSADLIEYTLSENSVRRSYMGVKRGNRGSNVCVQRGLH